MISNLSMMLNQIHDLFEVSKQLSIKLRRISGLMKSQIQATMLTMWLAHTIRKTETKMFLVDKERTRSMGMNSAKYGVQLISMANV